MTINCQILICIFQISAATMFKTENSFLPDSDPGQIDYGIEYNVYDVTPDVSIDFVSFTTEESEGAVRQAVWNI